MTRRSSRRPLASALLAVLSALGLIAGGAASPSWAAGGPSRPADLRNAPIPASCQHPATTLDGYRKDFGTQGQARLDARHARFGRLGHHRGRVAIARLSCDAGGVSWPELLLVYGAGRTLLGSVDLGAVKRPQEHAVVRSMHLAHHRLRVEFKTYDGAGFGITTYRGTLTWRHHHLVWHHTKVHGPRNASDG